MEADGNQVHVHAGDDSFVLRDSLGSLDDKLDPARFTRVHRKYIVNIARVVELEPLVKGEYVLILRGGRRLITGRTFRDRVRQTFNLSL